MKSYVKTCERGLVWMSNMYLATKALIINDESKVLILKRVDKEDCYKSMWDLPGGGIKFGEDPKDCLIREVKEETGIQIEMIRPIDVWTFMKNDNQTQVIGITILCRYVDGNVKLGEEHDQFAWIVPKDIDKYNIHDGIKKIIKNILMNNQ